MYEKQNYLHSNLNPLNDMSKEQNHVIAGAGDMALSAFGVQNISSVVSMFRSLFTFDVPPRKWVLTINGTEALLPGHALVYSDTGALMAATAGVSSDVTYLSSRRHPQYQANRGHVYSGTIKIPIPSDNAVEDFGLFSPENGVFFRVHTDGKLYACVQSGGVLTIEEEISLPFPVDLTDLNSFHIQYQCGGLGNFMFMIGNKDTRKIEIVHELSSRTLGYSPTIQNPSLPVAYRITSLGDDGSIVGGCVDISVEGGSEGREQYISVITEDSLINGTDIPILAAHIPNLAGSVINTRDDRLTRITVGSDKRTIFKVWMTRDPTALTGAAFAALSTGSFVQTDTAATALNPAKCERLTVITVNADTSMSVTSPDPARIDFFLIHGDYLIITAAGSAATCNAVIEFGEEV